MTTNDKVKYEKLEYNINRETIKISELSSGKIDNNEYLTGEKILFSNWRQTTEQARFAFSPLGKALEKQTETQAGALKSLELSNKKNKIKQIEGVFPKNMLNDLIINKLKKSLNCKVLLKQLGYIINWNLE